MKKHPKCIIQIPCYNEETTLPMVLETIPRQIKGVENVEVMIIDDGSSDRTVEVAGELGVDHIIQHKQNKGLATTFAEGIRAALEMGADIIVNTDGDNQYPQERIPDLIQPIIDGTHDIVVADRQTSKIDEFGPLKKLLQKTGSWVVNRAAGTKIPDAASGFRAYSRDAAFKMNVVTDFSYCTETIIYAGRKNIPITSVAVTTNAKTRQSRLFKNIWQHVFKSASAIIRSYAMHRAYRVFLRVGAFLAILGVLPFIRYIVLIIIEGGLVPGHLQSLIGGGVLLLVGFLLIVVGILADLIAVNRTLHEESLEHLRRMRYQK
jgi:glycosyltransferase involved in cell wall biosynthesis